METSHEESEFEKRGKLIIQILDELMPFTDEMSVDDADAWDVLRQKYVLDTGLNNFSLPELEILVLERTFGLPDTDE